MVKIPPGELQTRGGMIKCRDDIRMRSAECGVRNWGAKRVAYYGLRAESTARSSKLLSALVELRRDKEEFQGTNPFNCGIRLGVGRCDSVGLRPAWTNHIRPIVRSGPTRSRQVKAVKPLDTSAYEWIRVPTTTCDIFMETTADGRDTRATIRVEVKATSPTRRRCSQACSEEFDQVEPSLAKLDHIILCFAQWPIRTSPTEPAPALRSSRSSRITPNHSGSKCERTAERRDIFDVN